MDSPFFAGIKVTLWGLRLYHGKQTVVDLSERTPHKPLPCPWEVKEVFGSFVSVTRQTATTPQTLNDYETSLSNLVTISQINDLNSKRGDWAVKAMALLLQILNTWTCQKQNFGKTDLGQKNWSFNFEKTCKLNVYAKTSWQLLVNG